MTSASATRMPRFTVVSLVYFGCFSLTLFMCTPAFVMLMARDWHYSDATAGIVVSAGIIGNTLGGMVVGARFWRVKPSPTLLGAVLGMLAGYGLAARGGLPAVVGSEVFVAGLGSGILAGVSSRALTYSDHPHRYLSYTAMAQNLCAAVLMGGVLPEIGPRWGAPGAFLMLAVLVLPCLAMVRVTSGDEIHGNIGIPEGKCNALGVGALLVSTLTYYLLVGMVWTFLGTLGAENGIESENVDRAAGASNLLSLVVCLLSPWLERSRRMRAWSLWSIVLTVVGVAGMVYARHILPFAAWMLVMNAGWTLNGIVLQCLFPDVDPAGRFVGVTAGLTGIGYSVGAYVGGSYLESHSASSGYLGSLTLGIASAVVLVFVRRPRASTMQRPMLSPANPYALSGIEHLHANDAGARSG